MNSFLLYYFLCFNFVTIQHGFKICDDCNTSSVTQNVTEYTTSTNSTLTPDLMTSSVTINDSTVTRDVMTSHVDKRTTTELPIETARNDRLICYSCLYIPIHLEDGCHNLDKSLQLCKLNEVCIVERVTYFMPSGKELVTAYKRNCSSEDLTGCKNVEEKYARSTTCWHTCNTNRCNDMNIFPYDEIKATTSATTAETAHLTTTLLGNTTTEMSQTATSVPSQVKESTTSQQETTTSAAISEHSSTISSIRVLLTCVILITKIVF